MRRTRHVVLPVKSWQYIGLLLVSLACLTLGHVSRDREGRAGSLAGPELKHTAPHEVDACPNGDPLTPLLLPNGEQASAEEFEGTLTRKSRLFEHPLRIQERVVKESRRVVGKSVNIRDLGSRMAAHRSSDTRNMRAARENQRLIRLQDNRSEKRRSLHQSDDRRLVSLGRRVSETNQIRTIRGELFTGISRLSQRESLGTKLSDRQGVESREGKRVNRIDRGWILDSDDRRVRSTNRIDMNDRNVRNLEARERRINSVELIVERLGSKYLTDIRRSAEQRETNSADRRERVRRTGRQSSERSLRNRNLQYVNNSRGSRINMERFNVRSDERYSINRFSTLNLDRQKRSIPSISELRMSPSNEQQSAERAQHRSMENRERLNSVKRDGHQTVRLHERRLSDRLRTHSVERQERVTAERSDARRSNDHFDNQRSANRQQIRESNHHQRLTSEKINARKLRVRSDNRRSSERPQTQHFVRQERFTRETMEIRRSRIEADDKRFVDRLQMRDSNRQAHSTREKIDIRRSGIRLDDRQSTDQLLNRNLERKELLSRDRRTANREDFRSESRESFERRKIRMSDRYNSRSDRVEPSAVRRIRPTARTETSWVDSLRRSDAILQARRNSDVERRQVERLTREDRRVSQQEKREKNKEKQIVRADNERDNDRNRVNKNYLATVPYLMNNRIADNQNYELLKEIFVLALCTIYTASIFRTKSGYVKNALTKATRSLAW